MRNKRKIKSTFKFYSTMSTKKSNQKEEVKNDIKVISHRVVLFHNAQKKEEKQPDMNGNVEVQEVDGSVKKYKIVMWNKTSATGVKYLKGLIDFSKELEQKPIA